MGRFIIKLNEKYLEWSSIVDAPVSAAMTLDEFKAYYKERYGSSSMAELEKRLERVEEKGTSAELDESVDDTISLNAAGPKGIRLTREEIIKQYCQ